MQRRIFKWTYILLGCLPIVWLLMVTITYFNAALEYGQLPKYNMTPQPGFSSFSMLLLNVSLLGMIILPLLTLAHLIVSKLKTRIAKLSWSNVIFGNIGYLLLFFSFSIPPINEMVLWYLD